MNARAKGRVTTRPVSELAALGEADNWTCWICGKPVSRELLHRPTHPSAPTRDHIIPRSKGGPDHKSNYRLAHKRCNSKRGNPEPLGDAR